MQPAPLEFALFLLQLAVGGIVVTTALDRDGDVSPGFLFLNSAFLVVFGGAGLWLRSVLPAELLLPYPVDATLVRSEPLWWGLFLALSVAFTVLLRLDRRPPRSLLPASWAPSLPSPALPYSPPWPCSTCPRPGLCPSSWPPSWPGPSLWAPSGAG